MAREIIQRERNMVESLNVALDSAASIITKNYLERLEKYEIVMPTEEDLDIDICECGKFYKLTKLVYDVKENFIDKLTTIVNVAFSNNSTITTIIKSDGYHIDFYFGLISKNNRDGNITDINKRKANEDAFYGALRGNLIGSEFELVSERQINDLKESVLGNSNNCFSSVSGIVGLRDEGDNKNIENYIQGIENLVDSLQGKKYAIVMIADPLSSTNIQNIKRGYEQIHTQLSSYLKSSMTYNETDSLTISNSETKGFTDGISEGISLTQNRSRTKGSSFGMNANFGVNFILSAGIGISGGINRSETEGDAVTKQNLRNSSNNQSNTRGDAKTNATGKSLQLFYENKSVKALLDRIDKYLERLDDCENFGAFDCAAYVIAEDRGTALTVASNYNAIMRGKSSNIQSSQINNWYRRMDTKLISKYMGALVHPKFKVDLNSNIIVSPASVVSGNEVAIQIGLPKKSVSGISVTPMVPFGRNVSTADSHNIVLGNLYHMGKDEGVDCNYQKVKIDIDSLAMHTFITGSTGKGKSTVIYSLLDKLITKNVRGRNEKIKFMVIEPAKGEYKDRFGSYSNVYVFGTNFKKTPLLRINPFSFPEDVHVLEHIDRLIEIFNVCWPMYAAMPAVLKEAIERAYIVSGWDLELSECKYKNSRNIPMYPSFIDVLRQINVVMDQSEYSSENKSNYKGALCTRIKSLTNGLYSQIFTCDELDGAQLFDENVVVDLSRVGSSETKALIMGLLVLKLQEHRMSQDGGNQPLKHVTVLEEAHNILRRSSSVQSSEGSNVLGKSVEMLSNSIAEMRTYGEGFIIADQSPNLMDMAVIRNTNTKIILGLPDLEDRKLVGSAAGLNDEQIDEISKLKTFVAAVYQNNWLEPVLCNLDKNFKTVKRYLPTIFYNDTNNKEKYLEFLLLSKLNKEKLDNAYIEQLVDNVYSLNISVESKVAFVEYVKSTNFGVELSLKQIIIFDLFNTRESMEISRTRENDILDWRNSMINALIPSIQNFSELNKNKILAMLLKQRTIIEGSKESHELFNEFMRVL